MKRSSTRLATSLTLTLAVVGLTACSHAGRGSQSADERGAASAAAAPAVSSSSSSAKIAKPSEINPSGAAPKAESAGCQEERRWSTGPEDGGVAMSTSALYLARAGRHACFDRVVFDVNGQAAVGFSARYVPVVQADGSGHAVPVAGDAALEIVVRAPVTDEGGHQPGRPALTVGSDLVSQRALAGWTSLAAVKYAGSFEGQTTIAVGVRDERPFRVWSMARPGYRHVVLDVAH